MEKQMMESDWVLYGATGETGQRILEVALERGHRPTLAGRSAEKLRALGQKHDLPYLVLDLSSIPGIESLLAPFDLIVNVANPFDITRPPILRAALRSQTHYMDLANDMDSMVEIKSYDSRAREQGVCVMTGVGFGTVATGCLLRHIHERLPEAINAEIVVDLNTSLVSVGALVSAVDEFAKLGTVIKNGERYQGKKRSVVASKLLGSKPRTVIVAPMGDLQAAYEATAIPSIQYYLTTNLSLQLARIGVRFTSIISRLNRRVLEAGLGLLVPAINCAMDKKVSQQRSTVEIKLRSVDGKTLSGTLSVGEGYHFTAQAAVLAVETLSGKDVCGAKVPAEAFGGDFILGIDGVEESIGAMCHAS